MLVQLVLVELEKMSYLLITHKKNTDFKNEAQQQIVWIIQIIFSVAAGLNPPLRRKYTKKAISTFDN
jgi:hypothetical protein